MSQNHNDDLGMKPEELFWCLIPIDAILYSSLNLLSFSNNFVLMNSKRKISLMFSILYLKLISYALEI